MLVDSDVLAREVVAPGTDGSRPRSSPRSARACSPRDGELDRPGAGGGRVRRPASARAGSTAIVHPLVRRPRGGADRRRGRGRDRGAGHPVARRRPGWRRRSRWSSSCTPTRRCGCGGSSRQRGMREADARARIAAQASDERPPRRRGRRGSTTGARPRRCTPAVDALWHRRLVPFAANLRTGHPVLAPSRTASSSRIRGGPRDGCPARRPGRARRPAAGARDVAHVGPTAVPGLPAATSSTSSSASTRRRRPGRRRGGRGPGSTPPAISRTDAPVTTSRGGVAARGGRPRPSGAAGGAGRPGRPAGGRPCCGGTGCGPTRGPASVPRTRWPSRPDEAASPESSPERRNGPHRRGGAPSLEELPGPR